MSHLPLIISWCYLTNLSVIGRLKKQTKQIYSIDTVFSCCLDFYTQERLLLLFKRFADLLLEKTSGAPSFAQGSHFWESLSLLINSLFTTWQLLQVCYTTLDNCVEQWFFFSRWMHCPDECHQTFSYLIRQKKLDTHCAIFASPSWKIAVLRGAQRYLWNVRQVQVYPSLDTGAKPGSYSRCSYRATCTQQTSCRTQVC